MPDGMSRAGSGKLAFCRKTQPAWLGFALRVFLKLKKILPPAGERQAASLMGSS